MLYHSVSVELVEVIPSLPVPMCGPVFYKPFLALAEGRNSLDKFTGWAHGCE